MSEFVKVDRENLEAAIAFCEDGKHAKARAKVRRVLKRHEVPPAPPFDPRVPITDFLGLLAPPGEMSHVSGMAGMTEANIDRHVEALVVAAYNCNFQDMLATHNAWWKTIRTFDHRNDPRKMRPAMLACREAGLGNILTVHYEDEVGTPTPQLIDRWKRYGGELGDLTDGVVCMFELDEPGKYPWRNPDGSIGRTDGMENWEWADRVMCREIGLAFPGVQVWAHQRQEELYNWQHAGQMFQMKDTHDVAYLRSEVYNAYVGKWRQTYQNPRPFCFSEYGQDFTFDDPERRAIGTAIRDEFIARGGSGSVCCGVDL